MLILTRRIGETIRIGDDIQVAVLGVQGCQVKLGIAAPVSVAVHREEIYNKIQNEKRDLKHETLRTPRKDSQKDFGERLHIQYK